METLACAEVAEWAAGPQTPDCNTVRFASVALVISEIVAIAVIVRSFDGKHSDAFAWIGCCRSGHVAHACMMDRVAGEEEAVEPVIDDGEDVDEVCLPVGVVERFHSFHHSMGPQVNDRSCVMIPVDP